jgi:microsomal prostaglandin-E synthase 2
MWCLHLFADREKDERQWRQWTDDVLVHTLSPNIYRTPAEALEAFRYFSAVGEWTETFGKFEQMMIVYVGAAAMFFIGRILKKRY